LQQGPAPTPRRAHAPRRAALHHPPRTAIKKVARDDKGFSTVSSTVFRGFTDGVEPLQAEGKLQGMLQAVGAA
jgi:hypothetical protein